MKRALNDRCVPWGGSPKQPLCDSVESLVAIIIRTIEDETAGDDLKLSEHEAKTWIKKHMRANGM